MEEIKKENNMKKWFLIVVPIAVVVMIAAVVEKVDLQPARELLFQPARNIDVVWISTVVAVFIVMMLFFPINKSQ